MTLPDDDTLRQANWVWSNLRHELAEAFNGIDHRLLRGSSAEGAIAVERLRASIGHALAPCILVGMCQSGGYMPGRWGELTQHRRMTTCLFNVLDQLRPIRDTDKRADAQSREMMRAYQTVARHRADPIGLIRDTVLRRWGHAANAADQDVVSVASALAVLAEDDVTLPVLTLIGSKLRQRAA